MENNLVINRKIGAQRRFLKIKIFLFFDLKKIKIIYRLFLFVSSKCSIKIRKKLMIIVKKIENWMENKLNYKRKIGAQLRFLKLKIFLFFDFKKTIFYYCFCLSAQNVQ